MADRLSLSVGGCSHRETIAGGFCPDCETSTAIVVPVRRPLPMLEMSISRQAVLRSCPQLSFFGYELGLRPVNEDTYAADWGTAFHNGQIGWRSVTSKPEDALLWALFGVAAVTVRQGEPWSPPGDEFELARLRAATRAYAAVWGASDLERYEAVAVDMEVRLPALRPNGKVRRGLWAKGVIDLAVRERGKSCARCGGTGVSQEREGFAPCGPQCAAEHDQGPLWIIDHKTTESEFTGPRSEFYWLGAEIDPQVDMYLDAWERLSGERPAGFLWDVVRKPGGRKDEKPTAGESAFEYEDRLTQWMVDHYKDYFARRPITREPWQIERARADVVASGEEVAWRRKTGAWQRNRQACKAFKKACGFLPVCRGAVSVEDSSKYVLKHRVNEEIKGQ